MSDCLRQLREALAAQPTGTWDECRRFLFQVAVPRVTQANAAQVLELLTGYHELMNHSVWHFLFHAPWTEAQWQAFFRTGCNELLQGDAEKARYRQAVEMLRGL